MQQNLDFNRIDEVIQLIEDGVTQHVRNPIEMVEGDATQLLCVTEG